MLPSTFIASALLLLSGSAIAVKGGPRYGNGAVRRSEGISNTAPRAVPEGYHARSKRSSLRRRAKPAPPKGKTSPPPKGKTTPPPKGAQSSAGGSCRNGNLRCVPMLSAGTAMCSV
ncbi:unnamed protein product [Clonostachys rhizophaga]|uniref:Uncharacterized protein n=1 Tax=Clonostachys rhizophaga TaxID=160324 RepID=A0A9N9YIU0_9HYPO|nr:unnamed protein product [Clonostachys rhizophaga]